MADDSKITLTIHGLVEFHGEVDGEVFAEKFSAFIKGLTVSDEAANGERHHKFIVADLKKNTATATVAERPFRTGEAVQSSVDYFEAGINEIRADSAVARTLPETFVRSIVRLNRDVAKRFEFGEIKRGTGTVIAIDTFLADRAERVLEDIQRRAKEALSFKGKAFGAFEGLLRAVDYQPVIKTGILRLAAGGKPIKCNIGNVDVDIVANALEKRATIYGLAHYDGKTGLPALIDVHRIEVFETGQGLKRWRGVFDIEVESWGDAAD